MGSGASSLGQSAEQEDLDEPQPNDPNVHKTREQDFRKGVYIYYTSAAVSEIRLPVDGKYLILCRGAMGVGRDQPSIDLPGQTSEWDSYPGGGGACLEAEFNLTKNHVLRFLPGSSGESQGCGGGGTFVAYRKAETPGWDVKLPRPKTCKVTVPDEDQRAVGARHVAHVRVPWGTREASVAVPVPVHLMQGVTFRYKLPKDTCFFRKWSPLLVAGGGGGAGQCSAGQDGQLAEYGGDGQGGDVICKGGQQGEAGESSTNDARYAAHGGAGFYGSAAWHADRPGSISFVGGGHGVYGGGFGGGGGGKFAGGGGGGYSGGGAGGLRCGRNGFGGGGGGSFASSKACSLKMSTGHYASGLIFIRLLPDWRDPSCPIKDRIAAVRQDSTLDKRVQDEYVWKLTARIPLPGKCTFFESEGWSQHSLSILETDSNHKQRDRKVRYDDWNGASAHERFEGLASIDKYVDLASQKMSEFGLPDTNVIAHQETAAERADREMLEILKSFDETQHGPLGTRVPTARGWYSVATRLSRDASGSDPLQRSMGPNGRPKSPHRKKGTGDTYMFLEADVGAGIEFAKAVALGDVEQMLSILAHGYLVNAPLGSKGMPLHVAIRCGRLQSASTLIDAKCDVTIPDAEGVLAIQVAVQQPDFSLYKLLSEQYPPGNLGNILDKGRNTLLHHATTAGANFDVIQHLVEHHHISVLLRNISGKTARDIVVQKKSEDIRDDALHVKIKEFIQSQFSTEMRKQKFTSMSIKHRPPLSNSQALFEDRLVQLEFEDDNRLATDWLKAQGVRDAIQYTKILRANNIGYDDLHKLTDKRLVEIGVAKIGVRNLIMKGVKDLNTRVEDDYGTFSTLASFIPWMR